MNKQEVTWSEKKLQVKLFPGSFEVNGRFVRRKAYFEK